MIALLTLVLLIALPVAEIWLIIEVGGEIGALATIALIALTAIAGAGLVRLQGTGVLAEARRRLDAGDPSVAPLIDGVFLLVAGLLLILPGFITDAIGFLLLVPPLRRGIAKALWHRLAGGVHVVRHGRAGAAGGRDRRAGATDADYVDLGPPAEVPSRRPPTPWSPPRGSGPGR